MNHVNVVSLHVKGKSRLMRKDMRLQSLKMNA